jgi:hypothetical protein
VYNASYLEQSPLQELFFPANVVAIENEAVAPLYLVRFFHWHHFGLLCPAFSSNPIQERPWHNGPSARASRIMDPSMRVNE